MASSASSDPAASSSDDLVEDATAPPLAASTRSSVERLPLLSVRAGPRDGDAWLPRLKQELHALIQYAQQNKRADQDWFVVQPSDALGTKSATRPHSAPLISPSSMRLICAVSLTAAVVYPLWCRWSGKCWCVHGMHKFEFRMTFEVLHSLPPLRSPLIRLSRATRGPFLPSLVLLCASPLVSTCPSSLSCRCRIQ